MNEVAKKTRFIHKESGRVIRLSEKDLEILGNKILKDFAPYESEPEEVAELKRAEPKSKPIEIVVEKPIEEPKAEVIPDKKSVREIMSEIGTYTDEALFELVADERVTVQKAVNEELKRREYGNQE